MAAHYLFLTRLRYILEHSSPRYIQSTISTIKHITAATTTKHPHHNMSSEQVNTQSQTGLTSPPPTPGFSLESATSQAHTHQTKPLRRPVTKKYQSRVQYLLERCKRNNEQQARDRARATHRKLRILAGHGHKSKTKSKSKSESDSVASANEPADSSSFSESSDADASSSGLSPVAISTSGVKSPSASRPLSDTPTTKHSSIVLGEKTASGGVIVSTSRGLFHY